MKFEKQLQTLLDLSPSHVQRHFACDCAERALMQAGVTDKRSWESVRLSRLFAEGGVTLQDLAGVRAMARLAARDAWCVWEERRDWRKGDAFWATWSAREAAQQHDTRAAWEAAHASRESAWDYERLNTVSREPSHKTRELIWKSQIAHLQSMIDALNHARSSLLSVISIRAVILKSILPRNAQAFEEILFE